MPRTAPNVPADVLHPRDTWEDGDAYDEKARDLARRFRENESKYAISDEVKAAGPRV